MPVNPPRPTQLTTDSPTEVVIVGGGITGLASAYHLAERGANVTVVEQSSIGNGSTPLAAGGIRTQFNRDADIQMMTESVAVWESFNETFGTDIRYRQAGYLMGIRDTDQADAMERVIDRQQAHGLPNELRDPADVTSICPGFDHESFEAVTYGARDGYADPHSALMGFKNAAEAAGATIWTNTTVQDVLQYACGTVVGVDTDAGRVRADAVINAAGAWAPILAERAGVDLPIEPKARRAAVTIPEHTPEHDIPLVVDFSSGVYFRPLANNRMLVGGHFDCDTSSIGEGSNATDPAVEPSPRPRATASSAWQHEALSRAESVASYFGPKTEVVDTWEGRYAMTPDENPIIEESVSGLFTAAGFSGHGFMMAPAAGQLVADLVLEDESELANPAAYSRARFSEQAESSESSDQAIAQF